MSVDTTVLPAVLAPLETTVAWLDTKCCCCRPPAAAAAAADVVLFMSPHDDGGADMVRLPPPFAPPSWKLDGGDNVSVGAIIIVDGEG